MSDKKAMIKIKTIFLIVNLVIAILAFNYLIGAEMVTEFEDKNSPSSMPIRAGDIVAGLSAVTSVNNLIGQSNTPISIEDAVKKTRKKAADGATKKGFLGGLGEFFTATNVQSLIFTTLVGSLGGLAIGALAGGEHGELYGAIAGSAGALVGKIAAQYLENAWLGAGVGLGVFAVIFLLTYKKTSTKTVEFNCLPYEAPIGGGDCGKCNEFEECTEYTCKSLGQACELVNKGSENEKCVWKNPRDVTSPRIEIISVLEKYKFIPDRSVRPPATGVVISQEDGSCVKAFTPLEFTLITKDEDGKDEPSQCKIDYNLTSARSESVRAGFDDMAFYVGGDNLFNSTHTEILSLPGPDAINKLAPELKNDGTYTLYVRCQDANGNFNQDAYSVRFCVEPGPDETPPVIESVSIPSESPIKYDQTSLDIEVYVNEPSECKWSKDDRDYETMETSMTCDTNIWEMNNNNVYVCKTTLTGIEDRKENEFYFRCKDQPGSEESDRNVHRKSYFYKIIGTQPINILELEPNETIYGATDTIPVTLSIKTDNGYNDGVSTCYYSTTGDEDNYIEFLETGTNLHEQRQDLITGDYTYYFKCIDLGGNTDYNLTSFRVESDRDAPVVVRAYKEGDLKIITSERAECTYSNKDCNFEIDDGIVMTSINFRNHNAEWRITKNYYIRCKDKYDNQPNPNECSIVIRPVELMNKDVIEL